MPQFPKKKLNPWPVIDRERENNLKAGVFNGLSLYSLMRAVTGK